MRKPVSEFYVIEQFMGTIVEWYEYCALLSGATPSVFPLDLVFFHFI